MFNTLRRRIAEKIHPEKDNLEYWLMRSLSRDSVQVDVESLIKKHGKFNVKKLAGSVLDNPIFNYILNTLEASEVQYMAKELKNSNQFVYSRSVIHVIRSIREKINMLISLPLDQKDSFDKHEII